MNPPPKVTIVPVKGGRTLWHLEEDYFYEWEHNGSRYRFKIPEGFQSDGASVPWFLPFWGRGSFGVLPPLVHDWVIQQHGQVWVEMFYSGIWIREMVSDLTHTYYRRFTRRDADRLFFRILREQGVRPRWLRRWAFRLVRLWSLIKGDRY